MTRKCTYCHTPLPAPPLPFTVIWVCTPDGKDLEPACCDCYFERGLYAWGRQVVSEQRYHESHPQGVRADEGWYLDWAAGLPLRNPREVAEKRAEEAEEAPDPAEDGSDAAEETPDPASDAPDPAGDAPDSA